MATKEQITAEVTRRTISEAGNIKLDPNKSTERQVKDLRRTIEVKVKADFKKAEKADDAEKIKEQYRDAEEQKTKLEKAAKFKAGLNDGGGVDNPICDAKRTIAELMAKIADIWANVGLLRYAVSKIIMAIKWFSMFALAELLALVSGVAGTLAAAALQGASALVASALANIMTIIIAILISGPTAIFGLIAIPYDSAVKASLAERKAISDMLKYMRKIEALLAGLHGLDIDITDELRLGLSYINKAIKIIDAIIKDDSINELEYKKAVKLINQAMKILKPSNLGVFGGLGGQAEQVTQEKILNEQRSLAPGIKAKFKDERRLLAEERVRRLSGTYEIKLKFNTAYGNNSKVVGGANNTTRADEEIKSFQDATTMPDLTKKDVVEYNGLSYDRNKTRKRFHDGFSSHLGNKPDYRTENVNEWYEKELKSINDREKDELESMKAEAALNVAGVTSSGTLFDGTLGQAAKKYRIEKAQEGIAVVAEIAEAVGMLSMSIAVAQAKYVQKRMSVKTMVNFRDFIMKLLNFIIDLINKAADGADGISDEILRTANKGLTKGSDLLEAALNDSYDSNAEKYLKHMSAAAQTSMKLNLVNALLMATISDELIALTNIDNILEDAGADFELFEKNLADLKGFRDGKWVDELPSLSPYPDLTMRVTAVTVKITTMRFKEVKMDRMIQSCNNLMRHNKYVHKVLLSYTPMRSPLVAKLQRLLNSLGLADMFAALGGLIAIIAAFKSMIKMAQACPRSDDPKVAVQEEKLPSLPKLPGLPMIPIPSWLANANAEKNAEEKNSTLFRDDKMNYVEVK